MIATHVKNPKSEMKKKLALLLRNAGEKRISKRLSLYRNVGMPSLPSLIDNGRYERIFLQVSGIHGNINNHPARVLADWSSY